MHVRVEAAEQQLGRVARERQRVRRAKQTANVRLAHAQPRRAAVRIAAFLRLSRDQSKVRGRRLNGEAGLTWMLKSLTESGSEQATQRPSGDSALQTTFNAGNCRTKRTSTVRAWWENKARKAAHSSFGKVDREQVRAASGQRKRVTISHCQFAAEQGRKSMSYHQDWSRNRHQV